MVCLNSLLKDAPLAVQSLLSPSCWWKRSPWSFEGKFSSEQMAMSLDARHRPSLERFLCEADTVPDRLPFREMKISQAAVVEKRKSLALRYRNGHVCFIYHLLRNLSKHCIFRTGKKHRRKDEHQRRKGAFETRTDFHWSLPGVCGWGSLSALPSNPRKSILKRGLASRKQWIWGFQMSLSIQMCP